MPCLSLWSRLACVLHGQELKVSEVQRQAAEAKYEAERRNAATLEENAMLWKMVANGYKQGRLSA